MEVTIRNHLLHRQFIGKITLNVPHSIIAAIIDATDTIAFFHYHPTSQTLQEIFQGTSRPSGKKTSLAWSNDGHYLALGSANLQIWKFDGKKIVPLRVFNEDFVDIKLIAWSPDSLSVAFGGLCKKNTVKIRQVQTGALQEIGLPLAVSGISYDPFGKYLLLLLRNNILNVYNSTSLVKLREVPLSPGATSLQNVNTVRQTRTMTWSPDFNIIVCPSLDDSKIALAVGLSRQNNFKIKHIFLGHVSSVSCAKFNPNLYEYEGEITSILALGDSHGVVSLWRIGNKINQEPLLISNSCSQQHEVVEQLEWSQNGEVLLVNMMKRYLNVLTFDKTSFGKEISLEQKAILIQNNYGVKSASEIQSKQLQIFNISAIQHQPIITIAPSTRTTQLDIDPKTGPAIGVYENGNFNDKVQYVKVNEQVTIKDKNNRKKIQPAMLIRKDMQQTNKTITEIPSKTINTINTINTNNTINTINVMNCFEPLKLKPLQSEARVVRVGKSGYLEVRRIQGFTVVQLVQNRELEKCVTNQKVFTGMVDYIKVLSSHICILNLGNFYIFDHTLNMTELPYSLGQIHRLTTNEEGDVYYLSVKGIIRGYNHILGKCYTPSPLPLQQLLDLAKLQPIQQIPNGQEKDQLRIVDEFEVEKDHNLYITLPNYKYRYFYSRQTGCWISLQFNDGLLKNGHSLRVSDQQERLSCDYLKSITTRLASLTASDKPINKNISNLVQQYESNMIYYRKHSPNQQLFKQNLFALLKQFRNKNQSSKLRSALLKYLIDPTSDLYIDDKQLRQKVRSLGGTIIQQFVLFGQL